MKKASAIVTDHGGRTSHAAIVSRELGLTAIVGAGNATQILQDGQEVTVSCAEGDEGVVCEGSLDFTEEEIELGEVPETAKKRWKRFSAGSPDVSCSTLWIASERASRTLSRCARLA